MNKAINRIFPIGFIIVVLAVLPISVSANGPPPRHPAPESSIRMKFINVPAEILYADLLIKIDKTNKNYIPTNEANLKSNNLSSDSGIVTYSEGGYKSFTFHYMDAKSQIRLYNLDNYNERYAGFCELGTGGHSFLEQYKDIMANYKTAKIAFLDEDGNIVSVSEEFELPPYGVFTKLVGRINYDYNSGSIDYDTYTYLSHIYNGIAALFSITLEMLTALAFRFRGKQIRLIIIVNIVTQIAMRLLYYISPFFYLASFSTIILEALVYTSEFIVYRKAVVMREEKLSKILIYTIVANTLSLMLGLVLLNTF